MKKYLFIKMLLTVGHPHHRPGDGEASVHRAHCHGRHTGYQRLPPPGGAAGGLLRL